MTPAQTKSLELAGRVQYFTLTQALEQDVYQSETTARRHLRDLVGRGFLNENNYGVQAGAGRLPILYGLTPAGVRYLVEAENHDPATIKASKSNRNQAHEIKAPRDFHHRTGLIDTMLALFRHLDFAKCSEQWSELYFRKHGMHEPKRTSIELADGRLEPDAILKFKDEHGKTRFYLIELYEDSDQVERIRRAVNRHAEALATGAPSLALGVQVGHRVLCVFRHDHTARAVMRYIRETPALADIQKRFLFVTLEALKRDPFDQWAYPSEEKTNLY